MHQPYPRRSVPHPRAGKPRPPIHWLPPRRPSSGPPALASAPAPRPTAAPTRRHPRRSADVDRSGRGPLGPFRIRVDCPGGLIHAQGEGSPCRRFVQTRPVRREPWPGGRPVSRSRNRRERPWRGHSPNMRDPTRRGVGSVVGMGFAVARLIPRRARLQIAEGSGWTRPGSSRSRTGTRPEEGLP